MLIYFVPYVKILQNEGIGVDVFIARHYAKCGIRLFVYSFHRIHNNVPIVSLKLFQETVRPVVTAIANLYSPKLQKMFNG